MNFQPSGTLGGEAGGEVGDWGVSVEDILSLTDFLLPEGTLSCLLPGCSTSPQPDTELGKTSLRSSGPLLHRAGQPPNSQPKEQLWRPLLSSGQPSIVRKRRKGTAGENTVP